MEEEEEEYINLDDEAVAYLKEFLRVIEELGENIKPPLDPKIESLLEVVHRLVVEQLALDKKYEWDEDEDEDETDRFPFYDKDIPSAEDLRRMMEGD